MSAEKRIVELSLVLPPAPEPAGVYKPCLIDGKYLYVSGHGPVRADKTLITGKVGLDMDADQARQAARQVGLTILSSIKKQMESLDKVKRVIKMLGMVNSIPEFGKHPYVINGCSELFAEIWGNEMGVGVRSAVGMGSLPNNIAVEIEALFELY